MKRTFLFLLLPLLILACDNESVTPPDDSTPESFSEIAAANFDEKTTITQGVAGTIFRVTSADYAIGGFIVQDAEPIEGSIGLYEEKLITEEPETSPYIPFPTLAFIAITRTTSDDEGFYEIQADAGEYVLIASEEALPDTITIDIAYVMADQPGYPGLIRSGDFFFGEDYLLSPMTIEVEQVRKADVFFQTPEDPWWPPDTLITWPPDDSIGVYIDPLVEYWDLLERNRDKVTIETGIYGTVTDWRQGGIDPMPYPVRIHEAAYLDSGDVTFGDSIDNWWVSEVHTPFIAEVAPDSEGFFQVELPEGDYSVFVVFGEDSLYGGQPGWMDSSPACFQPGWVEEGSQVSLLMEITGYASWLFAKDTFSRLQSN